MLVVTGGAGFIGSRLVKALNEQNEKNIFLVDNLTNGKKFAHLLGLDILDYRDKNDFLTDVISDSMPWKKVKAIFHLGACSDTTEWNGQYMMKNNYEYSKHLLHIAMTYNIPFIYASSASVYGKSRLQKEDEVSLKPLNVYGYSKLLFDQYVMRYLPKANNLIVGLRYFNVFGPHESQKGSMASVVYHFYHQLKKEKICRLFSDYDGFNAGEQCRDFIYVDDIVNLTIWFWKNCEKSGIYNAGTGKANSFNVLADTLIDVLGYGEKQYIDFPEPLKNAYQSYTCADLSLLRQIGCPLVSRNLRQSITDYVAYLDKA